MNKLLIFLLGLFLGFLITYNLLSSKIEYRLVLYGYQEIGDDKIPVIKLYKSVYSDVFNFSPLDDGKWLEVGNVLVKNSSSFNDKEIDSIIRKRYCK